MKCSKCGAEKDLSEFVKCAARKNGFRSYCKSCQREWLREFAKKNPNKYSEYRRLWNHEHRKERNEITKKWRSEHPEKCRDWDRKWRAANLERARALGRVAAAKRRNNPKYRLSNSISSGILMSIKKDIKVNRHWEKLVDFTIDQLKTHLEKLFKPGMTWENYGTVWEIDHKVPIAVFNYKRPGDLDFRICWSLKNLQPLSVTENKIKKDKIDGTFQPSLAIGGN